MFFVPIPGFTNRYEMDLSETRIHASNLEDFAHPMTVVHDVVLPNNKPVLRATDFGEKDVEVFLGNFYESQ